jgi:hypothetical protein
MERKVKFRTSMQPQYIYICLLPHFGECSSTSFSFLSFCRIWMSGLLAVNHLMMKSQIFYLCSAQGAVQKEDLNTIWRMNTYAWIILLNI